MNIIAIDDEDFALSALKDAICEALPEESPICFDNAQDVLHYMEQSPVDVVFLDIKMSGMNGLALARKITELQLKTNIIFVTGYSEYLEEAFAQYASGYVKKPVRAKRILREIENLRYPPGDAAEIKKVKAIGPYTFDHVTNRVYYRGEDALLKPKEFLLFCMFAGNPGKCFTAEELYQKVWGNDPNNNVHTVTVHISSIRKKLDMDEEGNPSIIKRRGEGYFLEFEE